MEKKDMQNMLKAGNILLELEEIETIQNNQDSFLSMSTNTCGEFLTIICC